MKVFTYS